MLRCCGRRLKHRATRYTPVNYTCGVVVEKIVPEASLLSPEDPPSLESIDQSTHQVTDPSINQSVNLSTFGAILEQYSPSTNQTIHQPTNQSINPINRSINQCINTPHPRTTSAGNLPEYPLQKTATSKGQRLETSPIPPLLPFTTFFTPPLLYV